MSDLANNLMAVYLWGVVGMVFVGLVITAIGSSNGE